MRITRKLGLLPTLAVATAALAAGGGTAQAAETLSLDLSNPLNEVEAAAPAQSAPLIAGTAYVVTVAGTGTTWGGLEYPQGTCGLPEARPMTPSPGQAPTVAGWDAQTLFGGPLKADVGPVGKTCLGVPLPFHVPPAVFSGFQVATGAAPWGRPDPVGGPRTVPRSDHKYSYAFTGTGEPLRFRFADFPVDDNSGVFSIRVQTADECASFACLKDSERRFDQRAKPLVPAGNAAVPVEGIRSCRGEGMLSVRLKQSTGATLRKTTYFLNGRKKRDVIGSKLVIKKGSRLLRVQRFRGLSRGRLALRVDVTTTTGQRLSVQRTIPRCTPGSKTIPIR